MSAPKQKPIKKFKINYKTINLKYFIKDTLQSSDKYGRLFELLFENSVSGHIRGDSFMFIRFLNKKKEGKNLFYYGKFSQFTDISGSWVNLKTKEIQDYEIPDNLRPNLKEVEFVFHPFTHRIIIKHPLKFSLNNIVKYLEHALLKITEKESSIHVIVEQSADIYASIFNAARVDSLEVSLSYTNDDISKNNAKYVDDLLKDSNFGNLNYKAKADINGNINVDNKFVNGSLELAKNNGNVKAKILNSKKKKETINTADHPKTEYVEVTERNDIFGFANKVITKLINTLR